MVSEEGQDDERQDEEGQRNIKIINRDQPVQKNTNKSFFIPTSEYTRKTLGVSTHHMKTVLPYRSESSLVDMKGI